MNLGLEGRTCVILGGSRGIGRPIALGLAAEGANVAVFLVSPRAAWVVGECVSVDGGQHRGMR